MIVFDSYAWIEYFIGSKKGIKVKEYVESDEEIVTPTVCLSEIYNSYLKEDIDPTKRIEFISTRSRLLVLNKEMAILSARLKYELKLYLIDAIVYASSNFLKAKLLTGDQHFKGLNDVEFL